MLLARLQEVISTNGAHFETLNMGVEEGFQERLRQFNARNELEESALLKQGGRAWLGGQCRFVASFLPSVTEPKRFFTASAANSSRLTLKERAAIRQEEKLEAASSSKIGGYSGGESPPPPAYGSDQGHLLASSPYHGEAKQSPSHAYSAPGGRSPNSRSPGHNYVTALYDYAAQAEGDLSFSKDDVIEVIQKTTDVNDWWTGRLNGVTGIFPGTKEMGCLLLLI